MRSGRPHKGRVTGRRRWRGKLLLLSLLCGILYFAEGRYGNFRLRGIEVTPGVLPEEIVWQSVPQDADNFWPLLLWNQRSLAKKIEGFYPVEMRLRLVGWGRYFIELKPLEAYIYVSWNSRMWLLSTNGRMWLASLPANTQVRGVGHPTRPILSWDSGLALPIDPERQMGDIYPSSLPLQKIKGWYETAEKIGWYGDIYCLLAKKVDGKPVVQILLGGVEAITGEIIVPESTANWLPLAAALEELFPNGEYLKPPGMIVNATYSDMKFTVTEKGPKRP